MRLEVSSKTGSWSQTSLLLQHHHRSLSVEEGDISAVCRWVGGISRLLYHVSGNNPMASLSQTVLLVSANIMPLGTNPRPASEVEGLEKVSGRFCVQCGLWGQEDQSTGSSGTALSELCLY